MLYQVTTFLLEVVVTLVGGACLLRMYMHHQRVPMANQVGRLVQAFTDWLVLPLQKAIPATGRVDAASLLAAWLLKLAQYAVLMWMVGHTGWSILPVLGLLGVLKLAVSVLTAVLVVAAILSWTENRTPVASVFQRLCAPVLAPIRKRLPLVGGVDLSPLVLVVVLQVAAIVIGAFQAELFNRGVVAAVG